jgi:subtilisin family serine protease
VSAAVKRFSRDPRVLYAEPNRYLRIAKVPNDPRFAELWGLSNVAQSVDGKIGVGDADIDATDAWGRERGKPSVTVAIVDTGVAYDNPDLGANLWTNPGERGGGRETNHRDDDRDGLVDDWRGWDFMDDDNDPRDFNGHGTHVAGTIAARGNNGVGTTGVSWYAKLMPLRVGDGSGNVAESAAISAFDFASEKGARIVNASFTTPDFSNALFDAMRRNPRTLFVTAAGNGGDDGISDNNDRSPQYPCNFKAVNVICVGASDQTDNLAIFSNYGARSVDLAAPGTTILSTAPAYSQPLYAEGFEGDIGASWVTEGVNNSWARSPSVANSGTFSLSDSPDGPYLSDTQSFARPAAPFGLNGQSGCRLNYAIRLATEVEADNLLVEVSPDAARWETLTTLSGTTDGNFVELSDDLSPIDGAPVVYVRFRLSTNGSVNGDGAELDDISVRCLSAAYQGDEFKYMDGTSMAAPHVSGTAALIWSRYPTLGVAGMREALLRGVDRKPAFAAATASGGRLNVLGALRQARKRLPKLKLSGPRRQRTASRRGLLVKARCAHRCALVATGRLALPGSSRHVGLRKLVRSLRGGRTTKLVLKFSRRARGAAIRALASRRNVTASVTVTASNSEGNAVRERRKIRLRR